MAHPNEELLRRGYDAFSKGDVETLRQVFAQDAVFHEPGRNPVSGDYHGIDQMLAFFGTLAERSGGTFRVPCMMLWPATSMPSGCTSLRANGRDGCTASRR
jgi:ketosteroid isomerase-like protein